MLNNDDECKEDKDLKQVPERPSSLCQKHVVTHRKVTRCSSAEGALCTDKSSTVLDARNGRWAAARCHTVSG